MPASARSMLMSGAWVSLCCGEEGSSCVPVAEL
jgi:hypothetical protein